jgi:nucleotide-binding universal stress UspA family protein/GNAT superfamily N-acetyltransferase
MLHVMPSRDHTPLRDGSIVEVRQLEPGDKGILARGFATLSEEGRYRRFATTVPELSESQLRQLTDVDHHDHEALIATIHGGDSALGVARYVRLPDEPHVAEAAIVVADAWQAKGLGTALLEALADRARSEGIVCFSAVVQSDNAKVIRLLKGLGPATGTPNGSQYEIRIDLPQRGIGTRLSDLLRAAAAGSMVVAGAVMHKVATGPRPKPAARPDGHIETIVVGTDGSTSAQRAIRLADELCSGLDSKLHVVSAHNRWAPALLASARQWVPDDLAALGWLLATEDDAQAALLAAKAITTGGERVAFHARGGDPVDILIAVADEENADLIVVGNKGMGGGGRLVPTSVAARLLIRAPCNVFVAHTV